MTQTLTNQGMNLHDEVTKEMWDSIHQRIAALYPDYAQHQIGLKFGPGGGRIWTPAKKEGRRVWRCQLSDRTRIFVFGIMVNLGGSPAHGVLFSRIRSTDNFWTVASFPVGQMWMLEKPVGLFWDAIEIGGDEGETWEFEVLPGDCQTQIDLVAVLARREV